MSSVAICALLTRAGYSPVFQVSCRDRNRIAIQGDLLGAAAMGVQQRALHHRRRRDPATSRRPSASSTWTASNCLRTARIMRDYGVYSAGAS
jgi:methylenetetrahydrofolate reductase (NADPH)